MANLNTIYNATIRSEVAINSMKSDIRRIEEKVDNLTCMIQRLIDEQSTSNDVTVLHRSLNHQDYSSLLHPDDRTIQKPSLKIRKYRKSSYFDEFIFQSRKDLEIYPTDNAQERDRKNHEIQEIHFKLNTFTRTCVFHLISQLEATNFYGYTCSWKSVPKYLKEECCRRLELCAKKSNIGLDQCVDNWAAHVFISALFQNIIRRRRMVVSKDDKNKVVASVNLDPVDEDDDGNDDDSPYFGTDSEDEEPTIITAKREKKQHPNISKRRRTSKK